MLGDDNKGELAAAGRRQRARQWRAENLTAAVAGELGCVMDTEGGARAAAARRLTVPMALASIRPTTASGWSLAVAFADHLARRSTMSVDF